MNLTNLHNASASGTNDNAIGLQGRKVQGKKGTKRVVTLLQNHKSHNKISKKKNDSQSQLGASVVELKRGLNRIGKAVNGLPLISERTRKIALKRLQRLHVATRPTVKGTKKAEQKQ